MVIKTLKIPLRNLIQSTRWISASAIPVCGSVEGNIVNANVDKTFSRLAFETAKFEISIKFNKESSLPPPPPPLGAGIAQWLEHRTRDWKVAGSNPCWNGGRIFFSRVDFLCWLLFRYPFHPRVTTVARKKSRSFCQKCRWQVTAKNTHTPYVCGFYWTVLRHWSQLVPNMSNDIWGH